MDTFTIEARRSWLIRVLGGSPLVRSADRIEAWSYVMAALILAVATPFICAFGTSLQDSRARTYADEAMHRHLTTATAIEEGNLVADYNRVWYTVGRSGTVPVRITSTSWNGPVLRKLAMSSASGSTTVASLRGQRRLPAARRLTRGQ